MFEILFFLIPAAFANMAASLSKKINFLNYPIDFKIKFRNKRLFGKNKTWRGFFFGTITAIITIIIQNLSLNKDIILTGFLLGLGALLGDLLGSFLKRQLNLKPGSSLIFIDQTDWVIGALLLSSIIIKYQITQVIIALITFFIIHIVIKHLGYALKLENKKW